MVGGGAQMLGAALANFGVPKDSIIQYESEEKAGRFLVLAQGSAAEVAPLGRSSPSQRLCMCPRRLHDSDPAWIPTTIGSVTRCAASTANSSSPCVATTNGSA